MMPMMITYNTHVFQLQRICILDQIYFYSATYLQTNYSAKVTENRACSYEVMLKRMAGWCLTATSAQRGYLEPL